MGCSASVDTVNSPEANLPHQNNAPTLEIKDPLVHSNYDPPLSKGQAIQITKANQAQASPIEADDNLSKDKQKRSTDIDELLGLIQAQIINNPSRFGLLGSKIFEEIKIESKKSCASLHQKRDLVKILLSYMTECNNRIIRHGQDKINTYFQSFGAKMLRVQNQIFFSNKNILKVFQFLAKNEQICFLNLKFDLSLQETIAVAAKTRELCKHDLRAFIFLSVYLQRSCLNLEKLGRKITEIEELLTTTIKKIEDKFPPAPPLPAIDITTYHKDFKQTEKLSYETLDLTNIETEKRKEALENFILEMAKEANKNKDQFIELIESPCRQKGSHFKYGVKIKDKDHRRAIDRVLEKMINKQFKKYSAKDYLADIDKQKSPSITDFLVLEQTKYNSQMGEIYGKIKAPIVFKVSDLLRAKCLFQTVRDINVCATRLMERMKQKGFTLIELDNRLSGKTNTSDIVFKIQVGKTITELQLPIDFNIAENEFNHKIFEVRRSNFYSPITMLKIINEEITADLITQAQKCFKTLKQASTHEEQKIRYDMQDMTFHSLEGPFREFLKIIEYRPKISEDQKINEETLLKEFLQIKDETIGLQLPSQSKQLINKNNGDYYRFSHKYEKAIYELETYVSQLKKDKDNVDNMREISTISKIMGFIMFNKGKHTAAMIYYERSLSMNPNLTQQDQLVKAGTLNYIGGLEEAQGRYKDALNHYTLSLEIKQRISGKDSLQTAGTINNMGIVYKSMNDFNKAFEYYERSLNIHERIKGKGAIETAGNLLNIGQINRMIMKYSEAIDYYTRSLEIYDKILGKGSLQTADIYNNLGIVYQSLKKYNEAIDNYSHSIEIIERVQGKGAIRMASTLGNMGTVYDEQKKYNEALNIYNRSLKIQERVLGKGAIDCALTFTNIANVLISLKREAEAIEKYKEARNIYAKLYGESNQKTKRIDSDIAKLLEKKKK